MCGRFSVDNSSIAPWILDTFEVAFEAQTNADLRPTQQVSSLILNEGHVQQKNTSWGIKPTWSKKLLINAQSETVTTKKTFKDSFELRRCLVPCTGWYEWSDEGGPRKQKYSFTHSQGLPFLMAGILYENEDQSELVTLTTKPKGRCAEIHKRMPVLIMPEEADYWFQSKPDELAPLMLPIDEDLIQVSHISE